jgi:hypothetical protein
MPPPDKQLRCVLLCCALLYCRPPVHNGAMKIPNDPPALNAPALADLEPGWVWLTGAGPGDPGLLTLLAARALAQADVVVYDALVDPRILSFARDGAELILAGKRGGRPSANQDDISRTLIELAQRRRSLPVRARRRRSPGARPRRGTLPHRPRRYRRHWRAGICRHPRHPSRCGRRHYFHHRPYGGRRRAG